MSLLDTDQTQVAFKVILTSEVSLSKLRILFETKEEQEEKARLISQVLELQNTLDDLSARVDNVKEENLRLRSENQVSQNLFPEMNLTYSKLRQNLHYY